MPHLDKSLNTLLLLLHPLSPHLFTLTISRGRMFNRVPSEVNRCYCKKINKTKEKESLLFLNAILHKNVFGGKELSALV